MGGELPAEEDGSTDLAAWFTASQAAGLPLVETARHALGLAFQQAGLHQRDANGR